MTNQTSHHDEDRWHAQLANNDEAAALSAWRVRQREDAARIVKRQALDNRNRYMQQQRALYRSMVQGVGPAPSQHWIARAWRAFCRLL